VKSSSKYSRYQINIFFLLILIQVVLFVYDLFLFKCTARYVCIDYVLLHILQEHIKAKDVEQIRMWCHTMCKYKKNMNEMCENNWMTYYN
jgi:hypothetical protein